MAATSEGKTKLRSRILVGMMLVVSRSIGAETFQKGVSAPHRSIQFRADCSYPASLAYLMDNLSGTPYGLFQETHTGYRDFWKKQFGLDESDEASLRRYAEVRGHLHPQLDGSEVWPRFFVGSPALADVWPKMKSYLNEKDIETIKGVLLRFDVKFRPY